MYTASFRTLTSPGRTASLPHALQSIQNGVVRRSMNKEITTVLYTHSLQVFLLKHLHIPIFVNILINMDQVCLFLFSSTFNSNKLLFSVNIGMWNVVQDMYICENTKITCCSLMPHLAQLSCVHVSHVPG